MKSVLISIRPEWCALIASGEKTIEVRKTRPKLDPPLKFYIYCSHGSFDLFNNKNANLSTENYIQTGFKCNGKVIGEFICDEIIEAKHGEYCLLPPQKTQIDALDLCNYADGKTIYGLNISNLVIFDEPRELSEFKKPCPAEACENCEYHHAIYYNELPVCNYEHLLKRPPQSWCYVEN